MKISDFFFYLKTRFKGKSLDIPITTATTQENPRDIESVKRFNKSFDQQQEQTQLRALKAHDPKCEDVLLCKKQKCFKHEPDKIIKKSVVSSDSVKQDMKKRMKLRKPSKWPY